MWILSLSHANRDEFVLPMFYRCFAGKKASSRFADSDSDSDSDSDLYRSDELGENRNCLLYTSDAADE